MPWLFAIVLTGFMEFGNAQKWAGGHISQCARVEYCQYGYPEDRGSWWLPVHCLETHKPVEHDGWDINVCWTATSTGAWLHIDVPGGFPDKEVTDRWNRRIRE